MVVPLQAWLLPFGMPALARRATNSTAETAQLQTETRLQSWVRECIGA